MTGALAGLRVVELGTDIAAPYCTKLLVDLGLEPVGSLPAEFAPIVKRDFDKWGEVILKANIRLE